MRVQSADRIRRSVSERVTCTNRNILSTRIRSTCRAAGRAAGRDRAEGTRWRDGYHRIPDAGTCIRFQRAPCRIDASHLRVWPSARALCAFEDPDPGSGTAPETMLPMNQRTRNAEGALQRLRLGRLATLSVDLVGLSAYHDRLDLPGPVDPYLVHSTAIPRIRALLTRLDLKATFFVLAADLDTPFLREQTQTLVSDGHEIAVHGYRWTPDLPQWSDRSISEELARAEARIEDHLGVRPLGFRAPAFATSTRVVRLLAERGYAYDSSVFPSPVPVLRGGAAMLRDSLRAGRIGSDALPHPAAMRAPQVPYRPSRFDFSQPGDRKHSLPLWELPLAVSPRLRIPLNGDRLLTLPTRAAHRILRRSLHQLGHFGLRLRGIDLLTREDAGISAALCAAEPLLRQPLDRRLERLEALLLTLHRGARLQTMAQTAHDLSTAAGPPVVGGDT